MPILAYLQEFMILPTGAASFKEAMKMGVEVYHNLKVILSSSFSLCYLVKSKFTKTNIFCDSLLSRRSMDKMPPMLEMKVVLLLTFRYFPVLEV